MQKGTNIHRSTIKEKEKHGMSTRNIPGNRQSMALGGTGGGGSGSSTKTRQLVSIAFHLIWFKLRSEALLNDLLCLFGGLGTFTFAAGSAVCSFIGYGEFIADDECAG